MAVQKLSVGLEEDVVHAAKEAAERRGISLSAWLNEASRNALAIEDGLVAITEWEAERGPLADDALAAADAVLDRALLARVA
ncbi:MAG: hypothetical protein ABSB69_03400 [Solirubrobacteraceae bacterium]